MTSNLDCLGLGVADEAALFALAEQAVAAGSVVHVADGVTTHRWTDPSGARLSLGIADDALVDLLPSYAGTASTRVVAITRVGDEGLVCADVVDADGELATRLACDLEQWRALPAVGASGTVSLTGFGLDVSVHADEAAFAASPDSLLDPSAPDSARLAAESFLSYGLFDPANGAHARVSGSVSEVHGATAAATGQSFHVVGLSLAGLGLRFDVCLPAADWPTVPTPGSVLSGTVYLVASLDELWESGSPSRTRWFGRRS